MALGPGLADAEWIKEKKWRKISTNGDTPKNISHAYAKMASVRTELGVRCTRCTANSSSSTMKNCEKGGTSPTSRKGRKLTTSLAFPVRGSCLRHVR